MSTEQKDKSIQKILADADSKRSKNVIQDILEESTREAEQDIDMLIVTVNALWVQRTDESRQKAVEWLTKGMKLHTERLIRVILAWSQSSFHQRHTLSTIPKYFQQLLDLLQQDLDDKKDAYRYERSAAIGLLTAVVGQDEQHTNKAIEYLTRSSQSTQMNPWMDLCRLHFELNQLDKAQQALKKAVDMGDALACYVMGRNQLLGGELKMTRNAAAAFGMFQRQLELNGTQRAELAFMYRFGLGVTRNEAHAFNMCSARPEAACLVQLVQMVRDGASREQDEKKALTFLKNKVDMSSTAPSSLLTMIALAHIGGIGTEKDIKAGVEWMKKSANRGDGQAIVYLTRWLCHGEMGLEVDESQALTLIKKIDVLKDGALFCLYSPFYASQAYVFKSKNPKKAAELLQLGIKNGEEIAYRMFAVATFHGDLEQKADPKRAVEYMTIAAQRLDAEASFRLTLLDSHKDDVTLLEMAATNLFVPAMSTFGKVLLSQNKSDKGRMWLRRAAVMGNDPWDWITLAMVTTDDKQALECLSLAQDHTSPTTEFWIGMIYICRFQDSKSEDGLRLIRRAAKANDKSAHACLASTYQDEKMLHFNALPGENLQQQIAWANTEAERCFKAVRTADYFLNTKHYTAFGPLKYSLSL